MIPAHLSLSEGIRFLKAREADEERETQFQRQFSYRPHDGARATALAIRTAFGFTVGKTLYSFFGNQPPQFIDIDTGPNGETEQVPWGAMQLPGLNDTVIQLGQTRDKQLGAVFIVSVTGPRKYRHHIEGLFRLIEENLRTNSIYRGKSLDADGKFIDAAAVDPNLLVYTGSVERRLEGDLWSFIRYEQQLTDQGQGGKYAVLLEGAYGSGKTETAGVTAQIANDHGWTFLMARPGKDNLETALQMARLYPPAIVFAEDVDTRAHAGAFDIAQSLDMMDGFHTKGQKLIVVFTTNKVEQIHAGMLRPGRIGAVIRLGAMDRPGIETLAYRVIGEDLTSDVDFDAVAQAMDGYMPAFVKEALNRAVRYSIAQNNGVMGRIGTQELLDAADGLRDQLELMQAAKDRVDAPVLAEALSAVIQDAIDGTRVVDEDGDLAFQLQPEH